MNKENWIDDILNSTSGMERAQAPAGIYEGAWTKLSAQKEVSNRTRKLRIAAVLTILLLNAGTVAHYIYENRKNAATGASTDGNNETIVNVNTYNY